MILLINDTLDGFFVFFFSFPLPFLHASLVKNLKSWEENDLLEKPGSFLEAISTFWVCLGISLSSGQAHVLWNSCLYIKNEVWYYSWSKHADIDSWAIQVHLASQYNWDCISTCLYEGSIVHRTFGSYPFKTSDCFISLSESFMVLYS